MNYNQGFVYIATGLKYLKEAELSANSFKENMPDIPIAVLTDNEIAAKENFVFDLVVQLENCEYSYIDKILALKESPWEKTVFLDTDTYNLNPCYEIFELLDKFDLAVAHAPVRDSWRKSQVCPISFPELNTGVIAYNKSSLFYDLVDSWYATYENQKKNKNVPHDQPAFREALYHSQLRFTILTSEYNLRPNFSYFIGGGVLVKIIHCRGHGLTKAIETLTAHTQESPKQPQVIEINKKKKNKRPKLISNSIKIIKKIFFSMSGK
jgi:hypothetical protein